MSFTTPIRGGRLAGGRQTAPPLVPGARGGDDVYTRSDGPPRHRTARVTGRAGSRGRRPRAAPERLGRRHAEPRGRGACVPRWARGPVAPRPLDPGSPRGPVADRLDQPAGAQLRLPPAHG